jgi:hypothetical protein
MVLPPLELFSLKKKATLLPGGFFHARALYFQSVTVSTSVSDIFHIRAPQLEVLLTGRRWAHNSYLQKAAVQ